MYYRIYDAFRERGYAQTSVWSFNRQPGNAYSSVTRDYYVGFGPGAATYNGTSFRFSTFSIPDYIAATRSRLPVALEMAVSPRMRKLFWLYWRLYETRVPKDGYQVAFGAEIERDFSYLIRLMRLARFCETEDGSGFVLNRRGAHWVHLAQNYFALYYVNTIWSACMAQPWPSVVRL